MRTANIFHLVNQIAPLEDQISAGFGFVLQTNPPALQALLHRLRLPGARRLTRSEMREIEMETQVSYSGKETPASRIDLQITRSTRRFSTFQSPLVGSSLRRSRPVMKRGGSIRRLIGGGTACAYSRFACALTMAVSIGRGT